MDGVAEISEFGVLTVRVRRQIDCFLRNDRNPPETKEPQAYCDARSPAAPGQVRRMLAYIPESACRV